MTTTPRTDKHHHDAKAGYFADEYGALLHHARTLETELAAALKKQKETLVVLGEVATQRDQLKKELKGAQDFAEGFTREITRQQELRDNLQSQLAALTTLWLSK